MMAEAVVSMTAHHTLLAWEAPVPVTKTGAPYLPGNPYLLWEMVPGIREEMGAVVTVNALGFRGPEVQQTKPASTRRIIILGDSTVYGHGVADDEVFSALVDSQLGSDVQVLNLGTPGYSSAQSLNLMTMRGWDLSPDLVIIANLWSDNNFDSFVDKTLLSERGALSRARLPTVSKWLQASALYRFMDWHLRLAPRADKVEKVGWMLGQSPSGGHRRVSVNDYAMNLQNLAWDARAKGADVMFLAFANAVDLGAETDGAVAWPLYREVMQAVASRSGAPFLTVEPSFVSSGLHYSDLFMDEMHPTPAGHRIIADIVVEALAGWMNGDALTTPRDETPLPQWDDPFARGEGPAPDSPSTARVTLSGRILNAPPGVPVQVDLIDLSPDRSNEQNPLVGSARFDHVDPFEMPAPQTGTFAVRIYLDTEADGPSSTDKKFEFIDSAIRATGSSIEGLEINLEDGSVRWTTQGPTNLDLRSR